MKDLIILLVVILFSCSNSSSSNQPNQKGDVVKELNDSTVYSNKEYKLCLYFNNKKIDKFKLYNTKNNFEIVGKTELVTVDGEIPEGTNRIDYNNPNDIFGYKCDSTYQFISESINIAFAIEKDTKQRLDLLIYGSNNKNLVDGNYTLLKEN